MLSRVADNLYWMSRYLERAEHTSRVLAVKLEAMVEQTREEAEGSWRRIIIALAAEPFVEAGGDPMAMAQALAGDRVHPSSVLSSLRLARDNARQVREQISTEMWSHLNQLYLRQVPLWLREDFGEQPGHVFREILDALHMFEGIVYSTMRHGEGWYFIQLGRYTERAQLISRLLDLHIGAGSRVLPPSRYSEWLELLKSCTAFEAYCKVYTAEIRQDRIAEFLLLDPEFPHSVRFAVERMRDALAHVAVGAPPGRRAACDRLAGRLKASVDFGRIDELMRGDIDEFLASVNRQCEQIHDAVYEAYIAYGAETVL
jgi:uncharacterized alpha-E superfamily protein